MKNASVITLLVSMGFIIYFFVKEQFKSIILSHDENIFLSVLYLIVGISVLLLVRMRSSGKKR